MQNSLRHINPSKMIELEEDLEEMASNRLQALKQKTDQSKKLQSRNLDVLSR
jgi:hypothetical protein